MRRTTLVATAVGLCALVAGASALALTLSSPDSAAKRAVTGPTTPVAPPPPITISAITPPAGATDVSLTDTITVDFSVPVASSSPMPSLSPSVAGAWTHPSSGVLVFTPTSRYLPSEPIKVSVPGGPDGIVSVAGATLSTTVTTSFTTAAVPTLRLDELLAELDYLPLSFIASPGSGSPTAATTSSATAATSPSSTDALDAEASTPNLVSLAPVAGHFAWRFKAIPSQLAAGWSPGAFDVVLKGAVMAFESDHGLSPDGEPGPKFWSALLDAVAVRDVTTRPYDYLVVTETIPETLYVWSNGSVIMQSPANTGVAGASTELGTWPVYLRYTSTTMSGTNPDGTHYDDPGVPWVSYFNGSDAVHGFVRPVYGVPQSDGCVELPVSTAQAVYPYDDYGTLVTVTTGSLSAELGARPPEVIGSFPTSTTSTSTSTSTTTSTTTTPPPPRRRPHPTTTSTTTATTTPTIPATVPATTP